MIRSGEAGLHDWLTTPDAHDVLDDAVLGCLPMSTVIEICDDFDVPVASFRAALDAALRDGN